MIHGEDEDLVLDCYRLARFYHCDPTVFLSMPLFSEIQAHLRYTCRLAELMNSPAEDD